MIHARATARAELLVLGITVGTLGVGAVTIGPSLINASDAAPSPEMPSDPLLADACTALHTLIGGSVGVLRVWTDERGTFRDALLWHRDIHDPDTINRDEVVLFTYSPALGVLAAYTCTGEAPPDLAEELGIQVDGTPVEEPADPCAGAITGTRLNDSFPWSWKSSAGVGREIVASGLSGVRFLPVREAGEITEWSVRLTWGPENAEGEGDACAMVVPRAR
ncbi:MAG: hypothetical protein Tsb0013_02690 [Phycisphaerales bacterium]